MGYWLANRIIRLRAGSSDPDELGRKVFSKRSISSQIEVL
jgi:hypothetical protein